ncbi:MAG: efflux RND transporter periplasmic adaptor subunit [Patescibacteria group bacterium]
MSNFLKKIFAHKIILTIVILALAAGGYFGFTKLRGSSQQETSYVTAAVEKGNIIVSISGTGQVSALNQVDINPEASGKVISISVEKGQEVKTGQLIAQLDATEALKSVRDAQSNLESAKLSLEKLNQPADELEITKAQNALDQAKEAKPNAEDDLNKAYEDGFNNIANAFLDLPNLMAGLEDVVYGNDFSDSQWNIDYYKTRTNQYDDNSQGTVYADKAKASYIVARDSYEQNLGNYKSASRYSSNEVIEELINQTYETTKDVAETIKDTKNLIDIFEDTLSKESVTIPTKTATHQSNLETYTGTTNSLLSDLFSSKTAIDNAKEDIINAERTIQEQEQTLEDLLAGTDPLDIKSQEISIQQKENSLLDARQKLADYSIRAPFDGVIAELSLEKGAAVSSGTAVATLITTKKIAEITLNEIDAAKVKVGQKATLTFDAVEDLSISGEVIEIDTLGAVSSGVVSYGIKIAFDVQDERIKSGMSLSANIITDSKQDVLVVSASAVKTAGESSYVEVLVDGQKQQKTVTTGISNDTMIEITDGLVEGDQVITQTISGSSSSSANTNKSNNDAMRGMMQLNGGGGGKPPS